MNFKLINLKALFIFCLVNSGATWANVNCFEELQNIHRNQISATNILPQNAVHYQLVQGREAYKAALDAGREQVRNTALVKKNHGWKKFSKQNAEEDFSSLKGMMVMGVSKTEIEIGGVSVFSGRVQRVFNAAPAGRSPYYRAVVLTERGPITVNLSSHLDELHVLSTPIIYYEEFCFRHEFLQALKREKEFIRENITKWTYQNWHRAGEELPRSGTLVSEADSLIGKEIYGLQVSAQDNFGYTVISGKVLKVDNLSQDGEESYYRALVETELGNYWIRLSSDIHELHYLD